MGSFALLLIGMGLLALSIDMPMTLNKESDAQMLLRKATAQAAMEMQYTMYRCEAEEITGEKVSLRPNNLWKDCPVEGGGVAFLENEVELSNAKGFMEGFILQSAGKTRTQDTRYCIGGVSVRQNTNFITKDDGTEIGEYYLYAYMDYPQEGMFTNTTGGVTCLCGTGVGGADLTTGCNRVESGKLLTMHDELPYQIKLMFSVEASNKTATTARDKDALNSVGNTLDNIGQAMRNLGIGG